MSERLYEVEIARYERQIGSVTVSAKNKRDAERLAKQRADECGGSWEIDTKHEPRLQIIGTNELNQKA